MDGPGEGNAVPEGSLFPHEKIRQGQLEFYLDSKAASRGGKILFANAPTGIGKTAAVLSAVLEESLASGRRAIFLTHRNSHHIQAMSEARAIIGNRASQLAALRPQQPRLRIIDKVSKHRMCLLRAQDQSDDSPYLLCEIAHCRHSKVKPSVVQDLLETPSSAGESVKNSLRSGYCAHYAALDAMHGADLVVCDYAYLFEWGILDLFLSKLGDGLSGCDVIIDEAHNLPSRIMDINAHEIGEKTIKNALRALSDAKKHAEGGHAMLEKIGAAHGYLRTFFAPALQKLIAGSDAAGEEKRLGAGELEIFLPEKFSQQHLAEGGGIALSAALAEITFFLKLCASKGGEGRRVDMDGSVGLIELAAFLDSAEKAALGNQAYGVFLKTSEDRALFRIRTALFDPSAVSGRIFASVHSATLMSGTLIGKRGLCDLLGIGPERAVGLSEGAYRSPFDPQRQRVRICDWVSSRQRERLDGHSIKTMASIIDEAARACSPHSLAIFYPSYEYLRMVKDELVLSGFSHETEMRGDRHSAVEERKARVEARKFGEKPIAFHGVIGGSYSEGMDFRNNPFKLIVVAGFPFPKPDARHVAYEGYLAEKFKSSQRASELADLYPAAIKTAQAMGRGIRNGSDWCYFLLIDDRFARYLNYFQPSLGSVAKTIAGNEKRRIWEDVYHFCARMGEKDVKSNLSAHPEV